MLIRVRPGREVLRRGSWQSRTWHHGTRATRDRSAGGRGHIESIPVLIARWGEEGRFHSDSRPRHTDGVAAVDAEDDEIQPTSSAGTRANGYI